MHGQSNFEDFTYNRKGVVLMNTYSKTGLLTSKITGHKDEIKGIIYEAKNLKDDMSTIKKNYCKGMDLISDLTKLKDFKEELCKVEGSWLK